MTTSLLNRAAQAVASKIRGSKTKADHKSRERKLRRTLLVDQLEAREMMSVSQLWFSGNTLVVKTDNASTSVQVNQSGSTIRINEVGTNRSWSYNSASVGTVEFQGGNGNDRFVNNVVNLPVKAFGGAGDDYLEGYNGADALVGGLGNDTLVGYGGNDSLWGEAGNDTLRGMDGDDQLMGGDGNDQMEGGNGNDKLWGGNGNDVLLGGYGNDQLMGDAGNDQLNGQIGNDMHWGGTGNDTIISIDASFAEYVEGGDGSDTLWIDRVGGSTDNVIGATSADKVQAVASFRNGADRTLDGDRIADPTTLAGHTYKRFDNNPLFSSSGPAMNDVRQGGLGDCYALAGLAAIAMDSPNSLRQNIVDFNDGTYGVRLGDSFYRIDNDLPVTSSSSTTPAYAKLGAENSMWVALVEKAFAHYRTGANSYASIEGGWAVEMNRAFKSASAGAKSIRSYSNATDLANDIARLWNGYQAVTIGFVGTLSGNVPLIANHMYTIHSIQRNSAGAITTITLRNPHGTDGAGNDGVNDGLVRLTPAQLFAQTGQVNWGRVS